MMIYFRKWLIVFGGLHDNIKDSKYFNDVFAFDLEVRVLPIFSSIRYTSGVAQPCWHWRGAWSRNLAAQPADISAQVQHIESRTGQANIIPSSGGRVGRCRGWRARY